MSKTCNRRQDKASVNTESKIVQIIKDQERALTELLGSERILQTKYISNRNAL